MYFVPKEGTSRKNIQTEATIGLFTSTVSCTRTTEKIYDSIYNSVEEETKGVVMNLFHLSDDPNFQVVETEKQVGSEDCGLFAIATTTQLLYLVSA